MARKTRKTQRARSRPRQATPPGPAGPAQPAGGETRATAAATPAPGGARVGGDQALVRAVEMSLSPQAQAAARRPGRPGALTLEGTDAAIPLDRVPYFWPDLRQVVITGLVMLALLVVASVVVIPLLVK